MREIALFSGKIYTAGTNFTRLPLVTVATNLNSDTEYVYLEFSPSCSNFNWSLHLPWLLLAPVCQAWWRHWHGGTFVVPDIVVEELHVHLDLLHVLSKLVEDVLSHKLWSLELFLAQRTQPLILFQLLNHSMRTLSRRHMMSKLILKKFFPACSRT